MTSRENLSPDTLADRIDALRGKLGSKVVILGHHYQDDSVNRHVDIKGDSLELARKVEGITAEHIVFCGVYFMAESAALLASPGQKVHLPELSANCIMAQMAPAPLVESIVDRLSASGRKIIPLAYVNSSVAVKAVAGRFGGSVCTSANAETMLRWAMDQGDAVLFLPDKNLAWNTADIIGIPEDKRHMLNIRKGGDEMDVPAANAARLIMWPGSCAIHARFNVRQIRSRKAEVPGLRVIVHPECSPEVVAAADGAGSTSYIVNYVANAPFGSSIAIGTEINLIERLAWQNRYQKRIIPVLESECSHMDKTGPLQLLSTLEAIDDPKSPFGTPNIVDVDPAIVPDARLALERMLHACV